MKVKITGETIAAWDKVWLAPTDSRGKKLITVTAVQRDGDDVTVFGVLADTQDPVKARTLTFAPVDMEV